MIVAVMVWGTAVFAGPPRGHKHHKNDGLELANGIVDLVLKVLNPTPTVNVIQPQQYYRPAPPPPPPRRHKPNNHKRPAPAPKPRRR